MNSADQIAERILEQTELMVARAKAGDLEGFRSLQASRDKLVKSLEESSLDVTDPERVRDLLLQTKEINSALADALSAEQQSLLDEKSTLKRNQRAQAAYKANS